MKDRITDDDGSAWEYDDEAVLGRGGFGIVYRGTDSAGLPVAIKRIAMPPDRSDLRQMLLREGDIGQVIQATSETTMGLLKPTAFVECGGNLYIVLPLAERSLARALETGPFDLQQAVAVLRQIAEGLQQLQNIGVLHRDLKPDNVLEVGGSWMLSDFGLSRDLAIATSPLTLQGGGTPNYMAPEAWTPGTQTFKADLYALGVIAYDLLAGYQPFAGPDAAAFRMQHATTVPRSLPKGLPNALVRMVARLLAKDPAQRPQDARAVMQALDRVQIALTPAQEALGAAAATNAIEQAKTEAAEANSLAHEQKLVSLRRQAESDLVQLLQDSEEFAQISVEDVSLSSSGSQLHLSLGSARVTFDVWKWRSRAADSPSYHGGPIFAGAVYVGDSSRMVRSYPYANVVFVANEALNGGSWLLQRFDVTGLAEPRGFELSDYAPAKEEQDGAWVIVHNYTTSEIPLNEEEVVALLAEALGSTSGIE